MKPAVALTIAGSDSFGGAGIQADVKTFLALGVHGTTAITALTAQNSHSVTAVHPVPPEFVKEQISQIVSDTVVSAAKTGMLWSAGIVEAVAESLPAAGIHKVVVDPVLVSTSKAVLMQTPAAKALAEKLLPLALLVTPNLEEAAALTATEIDSAEAMRDAARILRDMGPDWVLIKGGHLKGDPVDVLYDGSSFLEFRAARVRTENTHGSGCTLAAAITARLALGDDVPEAVAAGKKFVTDAIRHSFSVGSGAGPVNQLR